MATKAIISWGCWGCQGWGEYTKWLTEKPESHPWSCWQKWPSSFSIWGLWRGTGWQHRTTSKMSQRNINLLRQQRHNTVSQSNKVRESKLTWFSLLEQLLDNWVSPIYAFFQPTLHIETVNGQCVHEFQCTASSCKGHGENPGIIWCYLDTSCDELTYYS